MLKKVEVEIYLQLKVENINRIIVPKNLILKKINRWK